MIKTIILLLTSILFANPPITAQAILDSMNSILTPENSQGKMQQIMQTSGGKERVFEYEYFSGNKGKNVLMRYTKPKKIKGNAFLMKNHSDDIWVYFPRTRRVRKLASHAKNQKVQGSDFSYEDFSGSDEWEEDYDVHLEEENETSYTLIFTRKPNSSKQYARMRILIRKSDFYPSKIEYYNNEKKHLKTLFFENIHQVDGFPTAFSMRMQNHVEDSQTIMKVLEMTYDILFKKGFFSDKKLKK